MRTKELLNKIEEKAIVNPTINFYSDADIYKSVNQNEVKYPILCMALQNMTVRENFITYTFQLYAAERLTNGNENRSYAIAELFDICEDFVHEVEEIDGVLNVDYDRQWNVGDMQTMDLTICIYGQLNINIPNPYTVC